MDTIDKFNNDDRKLIIQELERIQGVTLEQLSDSKKLFKSSNGLLYLIQGGKEFWHGINKQIVCQLGEPDFQTENSILVIAKKYRTQIDMYVGPLQIFAMNLDKLIPTQNGGLQFHCQPTEDGLFIEEIPQLICNKVHTIYYPNHKRNVELFRKNASLLNIEIPINRELTHTDIQAKLLLIGSYLNFRTYTPDASKISDVFGRKLGDIASEDKIPEGAIPSLSLETVKMIDVIWFDSEGYPTHAFEVEHTTDITKGLLRLYQTRKLRIKMFIISNQKNKFETEVSKSPFVTIKDEFILKNYDELEEFFESVKHFKQVKDKFNI